MRVLRFLLAAIVVGVALFTGFFALAIVAVIGLVALVVQAVRRNQATNSAPTQRKRPPRRESSANAGEVIDVVATDVADER